MITIKDLKKSFRTEEVETLVTSPIPSQGGGLNINTNNFSCQSNLINTY